MRAVRMRLRQWHAWRSESAVEVILPKAGLPARLVEEVDAVRRGLMDQTHSTNHSSFPDKVLSTAVTSDLTCHLPVHSESAIEAIQPKPGSPAWLVEEVEAIRQGLMDLLHNVVLMRCPDSDKEFYPVSSPHCANISLHLDRIPHTIDVYLGYSVAVMHAHIVQL